MGFNSGFKGLMNATVAQSKNFRFGVYITIGLKDIEIASCKNAIWQVMFEPRSVPVLSDAADTFISPVVTLAPNGQFLFCATVAFSERCDTFERHVFVCGG